MTQKRKYCQPLKREKVERKNLSRSPIEWLVLSLSKRLNHLEKVLILSSSLTWTKYLKTVLRLISSCGNSLWTKWHKKILSPPPKTSLLSLNPIIQLNRFPSSPQRKLPLQSLSNLRGSWNLMVRTPLKTWKSARKRGSSLRYLTQRCASWGNMSPLRMFPIKILPSRNKKLQELWSLTLRLTRSWTKVKLMTLCFTMRALTMGLRFKTLEAQLWEKALI